MKPFALPTLAAAAALATCGAASPQPPAPDPAGTYQLVGLRAAPGVARTLRDDRPAPKMGARVKVGGRTTWLDGQPCEGDLRPAAQPWPGLGDPMLSDVQLAPPGADRRLNRAWVIDCGGRARRAIVSLLQVDRQVVVASLNNGETLAILERPLSRQKARQVETALAAAGHSPGRVDGVLDAEARRALALYAEKKGAAFAFESGVLTENLLAALGV